MPSIVEEFPYPWACPEAQQLHRVLTHLYPTERRAVPVAQSVGVEEYELSLGQPAIFLWREILSLCATRRATRKLVEYVRDNNPTNVNRPFLDDLLAGAPVAVDVQPRKTDGSAVFVSGSELITQPEALLFHDDLSILVGLVPGVIQTLQKMMELAPAVCLLRIAVGAISGVGTGFRIGEDLLLTNHHVLFPYGIKATQVVAEFGFETDAKNAELAPKPIACDCASIVASAEDDWAVIRTTDALEPAWPRVSLAQAVEPTLGEGAFILQHPLGGRKRLGFIRNTVTYADDRVVHYLTDTDTGSSGAPVFNARGELIALHHAGGTPQEIAGKMPLVKNEGIRIPRIHKVLVENGLA